MTVDFTGWLAENYNWKLSLLTLAGILAGVGLLRLVERLFPTFRAAADHNSRMFASKMQRASYAANQAWNMRWGGIFILLIFGLIMPFYLTLDAQPWWRYPLDIVVILMVYDFFYYVTHRFVFHASPFFGGPLLWMHSVHHRQHDPCRKDSSYIHPLEVAIGLGLYVMTIVGLSFVMGDFHVLSIVLTWIAFQEINTHNHHKWEEDRFPFRYLHYSSHMHHNHHKSFNGGNFATITLLYDWMFGTVDNGEGLKQAK